MNKYEQSIDAQTAEAARAWHNRFGEPMSAHEQAEATKNINQRINERAAQAPLIGKKAVRGTGEGFWSKDARANRTATHEENWTGKITEEFRSMDPTFAEEAHQMMKGGVDSSDDGRFTYLLDMTESPYKPSKLNARRMNQIQAEPGSQQLPGDRPQA